MPTPMPSCRFVCPTEIIAFSDRAKEFEGLNCQVGRALCQGADGVCLALLGAAGTRRTAHGAATGHLPAVLSAVHGTVRWVTVADPPAVACVLPRRSPQLLAASTDTPEVHLAWIKTARKRGGLGFMQVGTVPCSCWGSSNCMPALCSGG